MAQPAQTGGTATDSDSAAKPATPAKTVVSDAATGAAAKKTAADPLEKPVKVAPADDEMKEVDVDPGKADPDESDAGSQKDGEPDWLLYPEWQLKLNAMLEKTCNQANSKEVNDLLSDADRLIYDCAQRGKPHHFPRLERALMVLTGGEAGNVRYAKKLLSRIDSDLTQETRHANQYVTVAFFGLVASPLVLALFFAAVAWVLDTVNFSTDLVSYTVYDANGKLISGPIIKPADQAPTMSPEIYANAGQVYTEHLPNTVLGFNKDLLLTCGILGVIGSIVSMIIRLGELENADGRSYREIFLTSIFRPFVGFCFAVLMLIAVQAGFLPFDVDKLMLLKGLDELLMLGADGGDVRKQASLMFVLCFLAGFSERLGRDLINRATARFETAAADDGAAKPTADAGTGKPQKPEPAAAGTPSSDTAKNDTAPVSTKQNG